MDSAVVPLPSAISPLLDVRGLRIAFDTPGHRVNVVDDVSYRIDEGKTLAIVGESGAGKSLACRALLDLRFDPWTERCNKDDVNYLSALRQSIRIQRLIANRTTLSFVLRYAGRAIVSRRQDLE